MYTLTEQVLITAYTQFNLPLLRAIAHREPQCLAPWKNFILTYACEHGSLPIVELMCSLGANLHDGEDRPLRRACEYEHYPIVQFLIKHGADVNAKESEPILFAISGYEIPLLDMLLQAGATLTADMLPNLWLIKTYHPEFLTYLIQHGHVAPNADTSNPYGDLPF